MLSVNRPIEISEKTHENCHYYTLLKDYFLTYYTTVGQSCWGFVSAANEFVSTLDKENKKEKKICLQFSHYKLRLAGSMTD